MIGISCAVNYHIVIQANVIAIRNLADACRYDTHALFKLMAEYYDTSTVLFGKVHDFRGTLTLLSRACIHRSVKIVEYLLNHPNVTHKYINAREDNHDKHGLGNTALHYAATDAYHEICESKEIKRKQKQLEIQRLLLNDKRVNVNVLNAEGYTPFSLMMKKCRTEWQSVSNINRDIIKSFINCDRVNVGVKNGHALKIAHRRKMYDVVDMIKQWEARRKSSHQRRHC